jgi:hypothetical protein
MAYIPDSNDPFYGGEKIPSLSWKDLPTGSVFTLTVTEAAKSLQSRNYESGDLDFWDDAKQQPKMAAVVNVLVVAGPHSVGEERSIWAQIPSNLFVALKEAQKTAGARLLPGGTLHLRLAGEKPHDNKRFNPIKQYEAKYVPPADGGAPDPFAQPNAAAQPSTPPPAQPAPSSWR